MLTIRFARTGKRHQAYFRIVVADKRKAVGAKFIEILGNYDPHAKTLSIDKDRLKEYMKNGAVPSNSVAKLLKKEKIEFPSWVKITEKNKAPKKKEEEAKEAPKEKPVEKKEAAEGEEEKKEETPKEEKNEEKEKVEEKEETPAEEKKDTKEKAENVESAKEDKKEK